jgi:aspartyl/asparaginyl beta-hydroxylase (cupin superfamily)
MGLASKLFEEAQIQVLTTLEFLVRQTPHGRDTFFDLAQFPWAVELAKCTPLIKAEVDRLRPHATLFPKDGELTKRKAYKDNAPEDWRLYPLWTEEGPLEDNCRRCPETAKALAKIPELLSANFSIMKGRVHIPPHRARGFRLRYHLGLTIPTSGKCWLRVVDRTETWEEGKAFIFDDTLEHEAMNESSEDRAILMIDFMRPMPLPLHLVCSLLTRVAAPAVLADFQTAIVNWQKTRGKELDELLSDGEHLPPSWGGLKRA